MCFCSGFSPVSAPVLSLVYYLNVFTCSMFHLISLFISTLLFFVTFQSLVNYKHAFLRCLFVISIFSELLDFPNMYLFYFFPITFMCSDPLKHFNNIMLYFIPANLIRFLDFILSFCMSSTQTK